MGSRYLVTGVQIGMLKASLENGSNEKDDLLNNILRDQSVGFSDTSILEDVNQIKNTKWGEVKVNKKMNNNEKFKGK